MTVIDYATGEVAHLTEAEARRLTERIRTALDRVSSAWADLAERVIEAYERRADLALGYGSWAEYADAELKLSEGLAADVRRQLVGMLSAQGMSTRAIAPVVGVTQSAVVKDLNRQVIPLESPEPERIDRETGEVLPQTPTTERAAPSGDMVHPEVEQRPTFGDDSPAPRSVVGLDGKTYTRPAPTAPRRTPLAPDAQRAAERLFDAAERMRSVLADDRLPQNREQVAALTRVHLSRTVEVCQDLLDLLTPTK